MIFGLLRDYLCHDGGTEVILWREDMEEFGVRVRRRLCQRVATMRMSQESLMELLECQGQQDRAPRVAGQVKDMKGARWHQWICLLRVFSSCSNFT